MTRSGVARPVGRDACCAPLLRVQWTGDQHGRCHEGRREGSGQDPRHVVDKFYAWVRTVEKQGIEEVRKVPGFHDEPLRGNRVGQRSIRLSRQWRAIYAVVDGEVELVEVQEVTPHGY